MSTCQHGIQITSCRDCRPENFCEKHSKFRRRCPDPECGGGEDLCIHSHVLVTCKLCWGNSICIHSAVKSKCKICSPENRCVHGSLPYQCTKCGTGKGVCEHGKQKQYCKVCSPHRYCIHGSEKRRCKICPKAAPESRAGTSKDQSA